MYYTCDYMVGVCTMFSAIFFQSVCGVLIDTEVNNDQQGLQARMGKSVLA